MRIYNTKQFIEKSNQIHNNKFDYSLSKYNKSKIKLIIICPIHGNFLMKPNAHLNGQGCPKCRNLSISKKLTKTTNKFILDAKQIYKNTYDYSLVEYNHSKEKIDIICKFHGLFKCTPNDHLMGKGCPKCGLTSRAKSRTHSTKDFITLAKNKNGNIFSYDLVNYVDTWAKVEIICPIHGSFWQSPNTHLQGHGCLFCKESQGEKIIRKYLIDNQFTFNSQHRFENCKNIYPLPFDFIIFNNEKIIGAIEFQGRQHYESIVRWQGDEGLKYRQNNDKIKKDYCKENNIPLLIIPYWNLKYINKILNEFIITLNKYY